MATPKNNMPLTVTLLVVAIAAAVAVFAYADRSAIAAQMNAWQLLPQPERFTELYFNNYLQLPKTAVARKAFSFSFTIHNLEGAPTTYPYQVYFEYPNGNQAVFEDGSVTVPDGATSSIPVAYQFPASDLVGQVVVELTSLGQKIDFIVPNTNP